MELTPGQIQISQLRALYEAWQPVAWPETLWPVVRRSAEVIEQWAQGDEPVYGVNTGFGKLAKIRIPAADLGQLQTNLVRSHAAGVGAPLDEDVVRLIVLLKAASLARGYSGVRESTLRALMDLYDHQIWPVIPCQGSVGASGDLAPLAHLTLTLMGEGEAMVDGEVVPSALALARAGLQPIELGPKEGLALLNGTQVSTALALAGLFDAERVFAAALVAGALSTDAARGSDAPFDARIHEVRGHEGQIRVGKWLRETMQGSEIRDSHRVNDERVQDPYSLRCQPQVMGAALDFIAPAAQVLMREANAVTDNPLVMADTGEVISGGNFHAEPVALTADSLAIAVAEVASLSERRIALLIDAGLSGLPPFLTPNPGLNSGFMIPHVTAASLVSENKTLAHPASVDSLPTSANQEDHVSMATWAGRKLRQVVHNAGLVVSIELLAACEGIGLLRPLRTSAPLEVAFDQVRSLVPPFTQDRVMSEGIELIHEQVVQEGAFLGLTSEFLVPDA
ncbi:MAG TPA: histidine ammonia-lyase [Fimbriimonadaceae bacterium]|nr:histidine ammonia-lyase [Armatimonadota bacterium]HRD30108.1 histidine ammonia-lyase [Fimbriimonadaceae bacterium]HRE94395.1 histidine ammonia-lyase [Fimbriimonadaceae bacterium]